MHKKRALILHRFKSSVLRSLYKQEGKKTTSMYEQRTGSKGQLMAGRKGRNHLNLTALNLRHL